jgi:hypothetical protein
LLICFKAAIFNLILRKMSLWTIKSKT